MIFLRLKQTLINPTSPVFLVNRIDFIPTFRSGYFLNADLKQIYTRTLLVCISLKVYFKQPLKSNPKRKSRIHNKQRVLYFFLKMSMQQLIRVNWSFLNYHFFLRKVHNVKPPVYLKTHFCPIVSSNFVNEINKYRIQCS